jgi:hypothetical protein
MVEVLRRRAVVGLAVGVVEDGVARDEGWYPARDPDGWFWERLERSEAIDDG